MLVASISDVAVASPVSFLVGLLVGSILKCRYRIIKRDP
jgi:hypothetical protein